MAESRRNHAAVYLVIHEIMLEFLLEIIIVLDHLFKISTRKRKRTETPPSYSMLNKMPTQVKHLNRIIGVSDIDCIANLRMDRNSFGRLCLLLRDLGGLMDGKYVSVEEQVALFLGILAHHKKNRIVGFDYLRSGQTVSSYVHVVLNAILKLHRQFLVKPDPVPEDSNDVRWKWFKGCLGALDGTYINLTVSTVDKPRYRSRKWEICTNTLAVCDRNLRFVYVLPGWEGSAADSRVLRDSVNRVHGLKVPRGCYYLCDNGYANSEGFLAPYKGVRYHLKEWGPDSQRPQNPQEMFNMRHSRARNVIERSFGIMKMRWGILRSASYYPVKTQIRLIMACFMLHNFIRKEMQVDPIELEVDANGDETGADGQLGAGGEFIDVIDNSPEWNLVRDTIAEDMWLSRLVV